MGDDPASRQSPNTLKSRVVPVVFVPGLMGTRLSFDQSSPKMKWDPDHGWSEMLPWKQLSAAAKAEVLHYNKPVSLIDEKTDNGWGALPKMFYKGIRDVFMGKDKTGGAKTPSYALGYDWRQSCLNSGRFLTPKIDAILESNKGARHVILITHSMGGLVIRSALHENTGLGGKVLGVVHVAQPVAGAAVLYRRLFTGMRGKWDGNEHIVKILGNSPYEFIVPMSVLPGVFQLLPTHQYRYLPNQSPDDPDSANIAKLRGPWESSEKGSRDALGRTVYPHGVSQRYLEPDGPPGLFNPRFHGSRDKRADEKTKANVTQGVQWADAFHESLALFVHKNTWAINSSGVDTDVAVKYPVKDNLFDDLMVYRTGEGDGTVPDASAAALFAASYEATAENARHADYRQFVVKGAEHAGIFDDGTVRAITLQLIRQMIENS